MLLFVLTSISVVVAAKQEAKSKSLRLRVKKRNRTMKGFGRKTGDRKSKPKNQTGENFGSNQTNKA